MYHTCMRLVMNKRDAEDILQDAFLEAFTNLNSLKNTNAFAGWMKRIVINKSINFNTRVKDNWLDIEVAEVYNVREEDAIDEKVFSDKIEAIAEAINTLPAKHRIVINLHVFEKLAFEDIAAIMQVPSATIRSQYLRARQKVLTMITK